MEENSKEDDDGRGVKPTLSSSSTTKHSLDIGSPVPMLMPRKEAVSTKPAYSVRTNTLRKTNNSNETIQTTTETSETTTATTTATSQPKFKSFSQPLERNKVLGTAVSVRTLRSNPPAVTASTNAEQTSENSQLQPLKKGMSYSQPLDRDSVVLGSTSRRTVLRKHSLDDDHFYLSKNITTAVPPLPPQGHNDGDGSSLTLERAMTEYGGGQGTLPEFLGNGGGTGIFRVPARSSLHPGRPPALEVRPHPLRETQAGSFLRTIVCSRTQLWVGQESGIRVWSLEDLFRGWPEDDVGWPVMRGDEQSAPFRESGFTSPTLCLVVDSANELIWSGHKDGKIRSWNMEQSVGAVSSPKDRSSGNDAGSWSQFRGGLSWQAHNRAPVLSMVITSYGEIWTGSEGGVIRAWPWDAIEKSLSLSVAERHMAGLLVERSYVDLRIQVTVNGVCSLPPSDVKYMVSDNCRSKVWSASSLSFALWDSRSRNLLKVCGIDGHIESKLEAPAAPPAPPYEPQVEDEIKAKFASSSKKEKHGSLSFFQRSRNALMGAADAVRRVAAKGSPEDNRKIEAIAVSTDGTVWTGFTNGSLILWESNGNRLLDIQHHSYSVQSISTFGTQVWVGYASGVVQVMDLECNHLGGWLAHSSSIMKMAIGDSFLFTLAHQGGIRGWNLKSPGPMDDILRTELASRELSYTKDENINILAGTWNVGQERASHDSLIAWLGSAASEAGLIVVGLQEVEMGAGFLAMAAAKETVGLEGSANGQWWLNNIGKTLGEGTSFQRVGSRQLAGLLIAAWARKSLCFHIGDVDAGAVPCGFGRAIGNKGAVGLRMRVYDRVFCFVNCHFAAHLEAVNKRNADFDHVYRTMSFSRPIAGLYGAAAGATCAQLNRGVDVVGCQSDDGKPELSETDMVVFLGDFNYRLHSITYDEARDMVSQRCFDWLREKDQLRAEMKAGKVFQGMREAQIKFPPTYKFERNQPGLSGYDSGEKKRIPAWCDRILYRDSRSPSVTDCSLECPVVASVTLYEACMDVADSDHKPVRCMFNVEIARINRIIRRQHYGEILVTNKEIQSFLEESRIVPETVVSTNNIILQNQETSILRITNKSEEKAIFEILCENLSTVNASDNTPNPSTRCSFGFPLWIEVQPAVGIIKPGQTVEVSVHHDEFYTREEFVDGIPQNWWCEDTRDKEVVLLVNVSGSHPAVNKIHKIQVRHCSTANSAANNTIETSRSHSSHLHRSDVKPFNSFSDIVQGFAQMR